MVTSGFTYGFTYGFTSGFAFLAALSQPILYRPGMADFFAGDAGNHPVEIFL